MIRVRDLCVKYGKREILQDVSLAVPRGEITVLLGANGCGKTTLLKTLVGLHPFTEGTVQLEGQPLAAFSPRERAARMAFMPQTRPTPALTVEQLLRCARYPQVGISRVLGKEDHAAVAHAADVCAVTPWLSRAVSTLSGGEQQRVYLAMALAQGATVLLLDEPTAHLDAAAAFETAALLRRLREDGITVVAAIHDLPLALSLADRVALMQNGRIVFEGSPAAAVQNGAADRVFSVRVVPHEDGFVVLPQ